MSTSSQRPSRFHFAVIPNEMKQSRAFVEENENLLIEDKSFYGITFSMMSSNIERPYMCKYSIRLEHKDDWKRFTCESHSLLALDAFFVSHLLKIYSYAKEEKITNESEPKRFVFGEREEEKSTKPPDEVKRPAFSF